VGACFLLLALVQSSASTPDPLHTLTADLAGRIAAAIRPAREVVLTLADGDDASRRRRVLDAIVDGLRASGVRVVDRSANGAVVRVACVENLRDDVCLAEIGDAAPHVVVAATRPRSGAGAFASAAAPLTLDVRPTFSQRARILDVAASGDRLLVLDPTSIALYEPADAGWRRVRSQSIATTEAWPRDLRGRLKIDGGAVDALLPGVACHGTVDLAALACGEGRQPWPIGLDNDGVDPRRNHFTTPEGLPFFGAAALDAAAGARWIVADDSGRLALLDGSRRRLATAGSGDDVTPLAGGCASGAHVLVAAPSPGHEGAADTLQLFRVVDRQLVAAARTVDMPGRLTALWSVNGAASATAVAYDPASDSYEAFRIGIACDR